MSAALWNIDPRDVMVVEAAACIWTCAKVRPAGSVEVGAPVSCASTVVVSVACETPTVLGAEGWSCWG